MFHTRNLLKGLCLALVVPVMVSCAAWPRSSRKPEAFEPAIRKLGKDLKDSIRFYRFMRSDDQKPIIAIVPFYQPDTGDVPKVSRDIERILMEQAEPGFRAVLITPENVAKADYVIRGTLEPYNCDDRKKNPDNSCYQVRASVAEVKQGRIIGRASVRFHDAEIDTQPIRLHEDSPVYFDEVPEEQTGIEEEDTSLETIALLTGAEASYGARAYRRALRLLREVIRRPDAPLIRAYAGIYSANRKLGRTRQATAAFDKLLSVSVEKYNVLTIRFLFNVNSVEFWRDEDLRAQYGLWLQRMGKYFQESGHCLQIVGHCSRSGTETYNRNLSLERAIRIQKLLKPWFPDVMIHTRTVGMGFSQTIKDTGTDDERDAIDRRVEFVITDCP